MNLRLRSGHCSRLTLWFFPFNRFSRPWVRLGLSLLTVYELSGFWVVFAVSVVFGYHATPGLGQILYCVKRDCNLLGRRDHSVYGVRVQWILLGCFFEILGNPWAWSCYWTSTAQHVYLWVPQSLIRSRVDCSNLRFKIHLRVYLLGWMLLTKLILLIRLSGLGLVGLAYLFLNLLGRYFCWTVCIFSCFSLK